MRGIQYLAIALFLGACATPSTPEPEESLVIDFAHTHTESGLVFSVGEVQIYQDLVTVNLDAVNTTDEEISYRPWMDAAIAVDGVQFEPSSRTEWGDSPILPGLKIEGMLAFRGDFDVLKSEEITEFELFIGKVNRRENPQVTVAW